VQRSFIRAASHGGITDLAPAACIAACAAAGAGVTAAALLVSCLPIAAVAAFLLFAVAEDLSLHYHRRLTLADGPLPVAAGSAGRGAPPPLQLPAAGQGSAAV